MFESSEIFPRGSVAPYSHGSTVQPTPDGRVFAAWYAGAYEKAADVGIYMSILDPGSTTWGEPQLIEREGISELSEEPSSEGNPVLYYDANQARLWLFWSTMLQADTGWTNCIIKVKHSDDFGVTWTKPRILHDMIGWLTRFKPILMSNGEIILPVYAEFGGYASMFYFCSPEEFAKGAEDSQWVEPTTFITGNVLQPTVVELDPENAPGNLLCYMRTGDGSPFATYLTMARSTDYGHTWSEAQAVPAGLRNPDSGSDMIRTSSGILLLAFNPEPKGRSTLRLARSEDGGDTWPCWQDLEQDPQSSFSYPAINTAADGTIHLTWSHDKGVTIKWAHFDEEFVVNGV
jgi:predicted neuraminidase